jgi:hypothetical protein
MVMTPRIGDDFVNWTPPTGGDSTLGVVDFSIFPHLGYMLDNTMAGAERWVTEIAGPAYAIDAQTGIKVPDGTRQGCLRRALEAVPLIAAANSNRHGESSALPRSTARQLPGHERRIACVVPNCAFLRSSRMRPALPRRAMA